MLFCGLVSFLAFFTISASDLDRAPQFENENWVAIDILETTATMKATSGLSSIDIHSVTKFRTKETGTPLFLYRGQSSEVLLNGNPVSLRGVSLFNTENTTALIDTRLEPGTHTLEISSNYYRLVDHLNQFIDINYIEGQFIEKALPANFMYDFYQLKVDIELQNNDDSILVSNGITTQQRPQKWQVQFPANYNSSYFFMDLVPSNTAMSTVLLESIDGRTIPFTIYSHYSGLQRYEQAFQDEVRAAFHELEQQLGPYPYERITFKVINNERAGAFAGALMFPPSYLGDRWMVHELGHSWYLKGLSPRNGYDGWFYEGFAEWARYGFPRADEVYSSLYRYIVPYRPDSTKQGFPREPWRPLTFIGAVARGTKRECCGYRSTL